MSRWHSGQVAEAAGFSVLVGVFNLLAIQNVVIYKCWAVFIVILGCVWPMLCRFEICASEPIKNKQKKLKSIRAQLKMWGSATKPLYSHKGPERAVGPVKAEAHVTHLKHSTGRTH